MRILDLVLSSAGLACMLPALGLIGVAIRLDSRGGAVFAQERVGRGGRTFRMYKFRTMREGVGGPHFTARGDPRITRVGRVLRRTSLDELPQLVNVLLGDMALVGPRPEVPAQRADYTAEEWSERHLVRPGLTGLAQVSCRSQGNPARRKQLDLEYVRRRTVWLDIMTLARTVRQLAAEGSF